MPPVTPSTMRRPARELAAALTDRA
jgi:hypothetical protein